MVYNDIEKEFVCSFSIHFGLLFFFLVFPLPKYIFFNVIRYVNVIYVFSCRE